MVLTNSLVVFADKVLAIIEANKTTLGIHSTYYGDQEKLPGTPIVCVEPDTKQNRLKNAFRGIEHELKCQIIVYHSAVTSPETNRRSSDVLAEAIETLLHANRTLDDTVIHCMVEEVASGYTTKAGTLVRANKIQFVGTSQSRLPS